MKKILTLLFFLIATASIGQYPINQILSSDSTMVSVGRNATGGIRGGLVNMVFTDTTAANLSRISYYTGAQIWTTTDSAIWVRFKGTPSFWVKMAGASGGTTGSFWNITGNYFGGGVPLNYGVGTNSYDYLPLKTNNITRLLIPPDGILRSSAPANKYLMMDTTTLEMYYGDGGGGSGWSLTGNAGTTSSNFIGTTDAQPLMFRYNNLNAGSIGKSSGGTYLGIGAGENDNAEDEPNVGVGYYALYYNTTGSANSAVGASALASNTTGSGNSAVGVVALYNNTTGYYNSAVGVDALSSNTTGSYNSVVGIAALASNTTGYNNSAVGASAGNNAKQKPDAKYQNLFGANTYGTRDSITVIGANFIKETIVRGKLIDSTLSAGAGTKAVRWNSSTGEFTYADTTAGNSVNLVFGGGSGASDDTAVFTTSAIYGSFYNDADTIVVTSMRSVLQGTSPDVTYKVWYNDSLNVEAGATALVTAGSQVTNTTTGTNVTSFDVTKIPPGVWVWVKTSAVTTKPTYFSLTINAKR